MKYFMAISTMLSPLPVSPQELEEVYIPLHAAHIAAGVDSGNILLAGPRPEGGGLMIARFPDRAALDDFLARDPFVSFALARFQVSEFIPKDRSESVKDW